MSSKIQEERQKAGYTIEDVSKRLKIRKEYIIAIESGKKELGIDPVYVEGYIKMYSDFLGIEYDVKETKTPVIEREKSTEDRDGGSFEVDKRYILIFTLSMFVIVILIYSTVQ